jgi:hypothetical protein
VRRLTDRKSYRLWSVAHWDTCIGISNVFCIDMRDGLHVPIFKAAFVLVSNNRTLYYGLPGPNINCGFPPDSLNCNLDNSCMPHTPNLGSLSYKGNTMLTTWSDTRSRWFQISNAQNVAKPLLTAGLIST